MIDQYISILMTYPGMYRNQPGIDFLKHVPAAWDETHVLNAEVGDYITMARKHGKEWYLGSITDWTPRELTVKLDFLGNGEYVAEMYADGPDDIGPGSGDIPHPSIDFTFQPSLLASFFQLGRLYRPKGGSTAVTQNNIGSQHMIGRHPVQDGVSSC